MCQALALSFCTEWPIRPVDVKGYWPPKQVIDLKKSTIFLQVEVYKLYHYLLSSFQSVFRTADNIAAGIV